MPRVTKYDENDEPIAGYRLVSFLGAGQFGEVWKANEETTRKLVAIKIIDLSHSNSALKELKALNLVINLNHPNLIPIFTARLKDKNGREIPLHKSGDLKQKGSLRELVIAMGLGDKSLSARLKELNPDGTDPADFKGLPVDELLGYMQGAAKGIDFLNKESHGISGADGSIVHCDIKPDNMMIVSGEVQIADCGVAVIITPDVRQTKAAGSPAYSAPELTGNKPVPGTDQYALAISYYEMRTGKLPFDEQMGQLSIMLAHAEGRLDFAHPLLTEEEARVLKWATAVRPKERYPTCLDMVKQLERAIEGLPPTEPSKIGIRSGVIAKSNSRQVPAAPALDPAMLRSTPNLPSPSTLDTKKKSDPSVSFEVPERDELRGTMIPDSDRYFQPNSSGMSLPTPGVRGEPPGTTEYAASQSEIVVPTDADDLFSDEEFSESTPDPIAPHLDARGPAAGQDKSSVNWSADVSRPQISVDGDDPMGARAGTVELDPEIAKIIGNSVGAKLPGLRQPSPPAPAVQTQRPPSRPDMAPTAAPNKRSTEFPRETPAEEEAKSLPPWAKEAKVAQPPLGKEAEKLPSWAKEAKAVEQSNRSGSQASIATTNWKEPDAAKAAGGMGVKLIVGGVLACGLAAGGAIVMFGGGGSSSGSSQVKKDDVPTVPPVNNGGKKDDGTDPPVEPKVDPARIAPIDALIAAKPGADLLVAQANAETAQSKISSLPSETIYEAERKRLNGRLAAFQGEIDEAVGKRVKGIEDNIADAKKSADAKKPADATAKYKLAQDLIEGLPQGTPQVSLRGKRSEWLKAIADGRAAMDLTEADQRFQAELDDLDNALLATFNAKAKGVYDKYSLDKERKKIGAKLVEIGNRKSAKPLTADNRLFLDAVIRFLVEDDARFLLLLPDEPDRASVFKWRTVELDAIAADLRKALDALSKGTFTRESPEIKAALAKLDELKNRRKAIPTEFGKSWNEKSVSDDLAKFIRLAGVWGDARLGHDIVPLRDLVKAAAAPDLALPMAMEYQRIGEEKLEQIPNLRDARDAAQKWSSLKSDEKAAIDGLFQSTLAKRVRFELSAASKPKWTDIVAVTCRTDSANGWKLLADAEGHLDAGRSLPDLKSAESTADDPTGERRAFVTYLKAVSKADTAAADELLNLYSATPRPPILMADFRKKRVAEILAQAAIVRRAGSEKPATPEKIFDGEWKPYDADARTLSKSLERLKKADELDGSNHKEWPIHLYLLASAANDGPAMRDAAKRASLDESSLKNVADLPFALAYYRNRALDPAVGDPAAYAATARIATRLMEATFEEKGDAKAREAKLLSKIADFAKKGLDLGPTTDADRNSLRLSIFRQDFLTAGTYTKNWLDRNRKRIEDLARDIPKGHPDYADARGYLAFVTLMRFSTTHGDLKPGTDEFARKSAWNGLIADAESAIQVVPDHGYANSALAIALFGTFKDINPIYPPPESRKLDFARDRAKTLEVDRNFQRATDALRTRENPALWRTRAIFLFQAANELAKTGAAPAEVARMFRDAATSTKNAENQRANDKKTIGEPLLLGRILEDLAWLGVDSPAENYKDAVASYKLATERGDKIESRVDLARTVVRAVTFGHFTDEKLADARATLNAIEPTEISALPDKDRLAIKHIRAMGLFAAGNFVEAEMAFAENAATDPRGHLYRAEAALAARPVLATVADAANLLRTKLVDIAADEPFKRSYSFAPDYLLARQAIADNDAAMAKSHFVSAFREIERAWSAKTLYVEDSTALRCLAHEIKNVNLNDNQLKARKDLLAELEKAFAWSLTPADKVLVAGALKK